MRLLRGSDRRTKAGLLYSTEDDGAHARIRTGDLFLTKEMLYRLSYVGGTQSDSICYKLRASPMPSINQILDLARRRITRLTPQQAAAQHANAPPLVDTLTPEQPSRAGDIPDALVIALTD